jgi:ASC-1-like (ASCH) protein
MNTLHLTLKKKWLDMISSGFKKEEYREIKNFWINRLTDKQTGELKSFDKIIFQHSYSKNAPKIELSCKGINIGVGNSQWGAENKFYFVIKLGEIIN